jgi:hypothetical protein
LESEKKKKNLEEAQKRKQELENLLQDLDDDSELPSHRMSNKNGKRLDLDDSDNSIDQIAYVAFFNVVAELKRVNILEEKSNKLSLKCLSSF